MPGIRSGHKVGYEIQYCKLKSVSKYTTKKKIYYCASLLM